MTLLGRTNAAAQEKAVTPERAAVRPATPGPVLRRALGNQALADLATAPPIVDSVLRAEGQPLDNQSRSVMESRFGHDFGAVRLHTGAPAARSAEAVGANAYTVGNDVVMGAGFVPGTDAGRRLLAHELTHVVQQEKAAPRPSGGLPVGAVHDPLEHEAHATADRVAGGAQVTVRGAGAPVVRRDPKPASRRSGPVDWKPGMRATLLSDVVAGHDRFGGPLKTVKAGTLVEVVLDQGFGVIQVQPADQKARGKEPLQVNDLALDPVGAAAAVPAVVPVPLQYQLLDPGPNWGAAAARSTVIGAARGIGYLVSPPVRGGLDPLLPLAGRLGEAAPLGISGDVITLERYLTDPVKELTPRYADELAELFFQQQHGQSWWQNNFGLTERQLGEMPGLVARMSRGGIGSLAPAEQRLVLTFLQAHAQNVASAGQKIASPALSATVREGLSALPEAAPFFREAPYVVRIQVPVEAVVDVNATLGAQRLPSLVYEAEVLVFTDARGAITSVRPNPVGALGRAAPVLRWAGKGFIVVGAAISVGRIATATPAELPRVLGEESGGWLGGAGGSALAGAACIAFGITTEGAGLLLCGLAGGIGGGLGGSYLGGELGEAAGHRARGGARIFTEVVNPAVERAIWGDNPIPPIGYVPAPR
ncbi:DUF4157 domain-containing protein [Amycolatopsis sp. NPDC049252]|uniref:eCIS core domain-containing protein n=1 Tax=Amycolatopsis sp. NPDC049252 TaxID=3363933 RepID=UPI003719A348